MRDATLFKLCSDAQAMMLISDGYKDVVRDVLELAIKRVADRAAKAAFLASDNEVVGKEIADEIKTVIDREFLR